MRRIKGIRKTEENYMHKILLKTKREDKKCETLTQKDVFKLTEKVQDERPKKVNCFQLVVTPKIPWYKKIVRNIRNLFVSYRWKKTR